MAKGTRAWLRDQALVFCWRVAWVDVSEATHLDLASASAKAIHSSLLLTIVTPPSILGIDDS